MWLKLQPECQLCVSQRMNKLGLYCHCWASTLQSFHSVVAGGQKCAVARLESSAGLDNSGGQEVGAGGCN